MDSTLVQQLVTVIQHNNYVTRTVSNCIVQHTELTVYSVIILTAMGYDYSQ